MIEPVAPSQDSPSTAPGMQLLTDRRREHWLLASMLLVLHAAIDAGLTDGLSRALLTTHLGLFFLWQPIWQKDQRLRPRAVVLIVLLVVVALVTLGWWTLFAWLVILIGLVAGRSFSTRQERYVYLLSLAFLVAELLISCTAELFLGGALAPAIARPFQIGLYLLPFVLYAIPPITVPPREPFPVDFFRGITFALLTALLAVLSVLISVRTGIDYPIALVGTLMVLGALLLLLSWLTAPGSGGVGLVAMWEKSVLNIGTPFEAWLGNIANLAAQRDDAQDFLEAAIDLLNEIPWIAGVEWRTSHATGMVGTRSRHHLGVAGDAITVTLFAERGFSAALLAHCHLLIQVLGHFYVAKLRENKEADEAHLRAIYATGARLTHDIKNLLQSLDTLAGALGTAATPAQEQRGFSLLKRRLPDIARRLHRALDKLERPTLPQTEYITAAAWWQTLHEHVGDKTIALEARLDQPERLLPRDCFDSIVDNFLDNARHKVAAAQAQAIHVGLTADHSGVVCTVSDDGQAIPADVVRRLFHAPVDSLSGHGIGLFQAARQAELAGCSVRLAENRDGAVRFSVHYSGDGPGAAAVGRGN
ncbi:MAG: ATP-binding protein [Gammaproteobacteria bacterium]